MLETFRAHLNQGEQVTESKVKRTINYINERKMSLSFAASVPITMAICPEVPTTNPIVMGGGILFYSTVAYAFGRYMETHPQEKSIK